jgi:predicted nucleic acid-binding protein
MTGAYSENSETLVCDTSFVGHLSRPWRTPERYEHWDEAFVDRVEAASLAVSLVTIAESRAGYLSTGWGGSRLSKAELQLRRFRWIPVGRIYVQEWVRLRVAFRARGIAISDNDLWVAATACVRENALVTCDRDHLRIAPELGVEVLFLRPPV